MNQLSAFANQPRATWSCVLVLAVAAASLVASPAQARTGPASTPFAAPVAQSGPISEVSREASEATAEETGEAPITQEPASGHAEGEESEDHGGEVSTGGSPLAITGLVDTYYTINANYPADGVNTLYYSNPNARGFGLNQVKLELEAGGDGPIGVRSDIWFGSGARLFREGLEPGPLSDVIYLQQAYGFYRFREAQLDFGLFGTISGLEVPESHLNWNYTRGLLWAWNEPFSHLGARLSVPLTETLSGGLLLVNGFDNAFDQNTGKSYGTQLSYAAGDRFSTTATWIHGPENEGSNEGWLRHASWNAWLQLSDRFEIMGNFDYISNPDPAGVFATSWGLGGYLRFHATDRVRIASRFEFMRDPDGRATGVSQNLAEETLTLDVQPVADDPRFLARFETRYDWSDQDWFSCGSCSGGAAGTVDSQLTFTVGLVWVFGPK